MGKGKSQFAPWQSELARLGFLRLGTGGRKGTYLGRQVGSLEQAIGVLVSDDRQGAFNVQLNINMPLRCAEPLHKVVILEGDLAADAVRVREPWVHDPAFSTWWLADKTTQAWAALRNAGLDWLERHSEVNTLVQYFEAEFDRYQRPLQPRKPSLLAKLYRRLGVDNSPPKTAHYQYLLWLSMLYEILGDIPRARERLAAYSLEIQSRGIRSEKERLERHRQALEAAS